MKHDPVKSFLSGAVSGLLSGGVMMLVYAGVAHLGPLMGMSLLAPMATPAIVGLMLVTTLFTGVMAAVRSGKEAKADAVAAASATAVTPVIAQGMGRAPQMAMDASEDMQTGRSDGKSWAAVAGRSESSQSRVQQILNDGSMSDKSRASAILAERDQAASAEAAR